MSKFKCNKDGNCLKCGDCCHFRDPQVLSEGEDTQLRRQIWRQKSILYLYPFYRYTISLSLKEKEVLERKAKELNILVKFIPKKVMLDGEFNPVVIDYCIDSEVCPFLNENNECLIYKDRPMVCRTFPKNFIPSVDVKVIEHNGVTFEEAIKHAKKLSFT